LSVETARDWVIIFAGSALFFLFAAAFVFTVLLGLASRSTLGTARDLIKNDVSPMVDNASQTVRQVRGTTAFIGETAVTPIIRVYGIVAGTRKAINVLSGMIARRGRQG
jgi:hypothetical protein